MASLHEVPGAQNILQLSGEEKAEKLLRMLDPVQERQRTIWTWIPPALSRKPDDIAKVIYNAIFPTFFQVTLRQWLAYLDGSNVAAVDLLLIAFKSISTHIKQLPRQEYEEVKKVSLHGWLP